MQRRGDLLEEIAGYGNLQSAYYKAQKGKSAKPDVYTYGKNLDGNLRTLREEIISGNVSVGNYHFFTVFDPKERVVCAAPFPQRVLHHALMNVCHASFEKSQIAHSYASRRGKGTFAAIERAKAYCGRYAWFCKLDVRKYFDSLDHTMLKNLLQRMFKDRRLIGIFERIIDSYHTIPAGGVPIGNLTSQYFANHYLSVADHYVKEWLHVPAYVRYMDDMVLWDDDQERLKGTVSNLSTFINEKLRLQLKPLCLNRSARGLPFLGFLLFPGRVLLACRSRKRFAAKMRIGTTKLDIGLWSQKEYHDHVVPLIAFTEHADAREFRRRLFYG